MVDIGDILRKIQQLHPEFSLKIGQAKGSIVAEMRIANQKPATAMGANLAAVLYQVHSGAVKNLADKLLAESRMSEAVFDNAVAKLESDSGGCCCCTGCRPNDDDDEYYDEYSEDFDDDNN